MTTCACWRKFASSWAETCLRNVVSQGGVLPRLMTSGRPTVENGQTTMFTQRRCRRLPKLHVRHEVFGQLRLVNDSKDVRVGIFCVYRRAADRPIGWENTHRGRIHERLWLLKDWGDGSIRQPLPLQQLCESCSSVTQQSPLAGLDRMSVQDLAPGR